MPLDPILNGLPAAMIQTLCAPVAPVRYQISVLEVVVCAIALVAFVKDVGLVIQLVPPPLVSPQRTSVTFMVDALFDIAIGTSSRGLFLPEGIVNE
jgi:hypothetical protein